MRPFKLFCLVLLSLWISACSHRSTFTEESRTTGFDSREITTLYIYSLLDVRRDFTGEAFLKVFQHTLDARLSSRGMRTEWLWFEDSPVGQNFSAIEKSDKDGNGKLIPVSLMLLLNQNKEKSAEATHRLVVFPKTVGLTGIHQAEEEYYASLTWTLSRAAETQPVLKGTSQFYSRPHRASSDLQDDVDSLVDDFIQALYPNEIQPGSNP
ncbi:MAG: hypothetical protein KJ989_06490 [Gammaproteobacteria bacterium]|nr:hypothetical protein [Gammaproteobacteria bacterium]MBU2156809.1 hypothetical protein [Gammaproteobacteria bacterium]MBU2253445.1 hypothetical protein [Gammaproteobacteria bacterium]MBU2293835.1 hypothetical protein [Gammaproteobacteria bacterium]